MGHISTSISYGKAGRVTSYFKSPTVEQPPVGFRELGAKQESHWVGKIFWKGHAHRRSPGLLLAMFFAGFVLSSSSLSSSPSPRRFLFPLWLVLGVLEGGVGGATKLPGNARELPGDMMLFPWKPAAPFATKNVDEEQNRVRRLATLVNWRAADMGVRSTATKNTNVQKRPVLRQRINGF